MRDTLRTAYLAKRKEENFLPWPALSVAFLMLFCTEFIRCVPYLISGADKGHCLVHLAGLEAYSYGQNMNGSLPGLMDHHQDLHLLLSFERNRHFSLVYCTVLYSRGVSLFGPRDFVIKITLSPGAWSSLLLSFMINRTVIALRNNFVTGRLPDQFPRPFGKVEEQKTFLFFVFKMYMRLQLDELELHTNGLYLELASSQV